MMIKKFLCLALFAGLMTACNSESSNAAKTSPAKGKNTTSTEEAGAFPAVRIAYIMTDTLLANYAYHKELSTNFEAKAKKAEADLAYYSKAFEENYQVLLQQQANLSQQELQTAQMELQQKQQELMQMRDQKTAELQQEEAELMQIIMDEVREVIDEVRADIGVDFIMSKGPGSNLMSANSELDVTQRVVEKLNARYAKQKEENEEK